MILTIKGYPDYRIITDTQTVERYKAGKWEKASYYKRCQYWTLYKKEPRANGRKTALKAVYLRLLYAAQNQIDPDEIPRGIKFIVNGTGEIKPVSVLYFVSEWKAARQELDPVQEYEAGMTWINKVLESYRTNDFNPVIRQLYEYEPEITDWIRRKGRGRDMDEAREIFHEAVIKVLDVIIMRKGTILHPANYIRYVIRQCIHKVHRERITQYNDNLWYY